jgi:hypothetical protein
MRTRRASAFSPVEDLQMRFVLDQQIFVDGRALILYQRYGRRLESSRFINRLSYEGSVRVK